MAVSKSELEKLMLTPAEAMAMINVGRNTIYSMIASGELHARRIGAKKLLIPRAEIMRWVESTNEK